MFKIVYCVPTLREKKRYEYWTKPRYEQTDTIQYAAPETSVATTGLRHFVCSKHS